ncbi:MAG: ATP-binding protein [Rickettsiales bacterium]|jgi:AAA+ ATPase superfamily predicted ATPase|nr:ATP-binding protein [Rickettsiales bacterium]
MNPFAYGTIVTASQFYDRKEECVKLIDTLSGGNNMILYAPRRFGKTSLVFRVIEQLENQGFLCIYFDFMPVFSLESFVRLYTKAISKKITNPNAFVRNVMSTIKSIRPILSFGQDGNPEFSMDFANTDIDETVISELLDLPEKLAGKNKRVIVFFDEFQEVEKLKKIKLEALLRSKMQQQQRTKYLFFGSKTHLLSEMFNDKKRAFYNSALQMTIGSLPKGDSIRFIQSNFSASNISIDDETSEYLIHTAANIPHYIQLLSSEVWQKAVNSIPVVKKELIDECAKNVVFHKSDYYMELYDRQSQSRKQLLRALTVEGANVFSSAYIKKYRLPVAATLQRAVKELVNDGIIEKTDDRYYISDPFFKSFVAHY